MSADAFQRLIQTVENSRGVPATERTVVSVLGALDNHEQGRGAVVGHIIEDFALTQRVLKLANSSMYAPFGAGAPSVTAALEVLDSEALLHLVLSTDLVSDEELQADHNLSRTLFASELARSACADRAEDASIATLMFQIGQLMVGQFLPTEAAEIAQMMASGVDAQTASSAVLGMSYQDIGLDMASRWNLPEFIRSTISGAGDPTLCAIARFSSDVSTLVHAGMDDAAREKIAAMDVPGADPGAVQHLVARKLAALMPTDADAQDSAAPLDAPGDTGAADGVHSAIRQEKHRVLDELAASMLPLYAKELQCSRCMLLMLTRGGEFRVRAAYGASTEVLRDLLHVTAAFQPTAFHLAARHNTEIVIDDATRLKPTALPLILREVQPPARQMAILPIANSRVTGLLYCDWEKDGGLSVSARNAMRKLRDLFVPFFP